MARTPEYWFRQKYNLPPTDPRFLSMGRVEIEIEFWAEQFFKKIQKGQDPTVDEFDTDFVDEALEKWEKEDTDFLEAMRLKDHTSEWEEVTDN